MGKTRIKALSSKRGAIADKPDQSAKFQARAELTQQIAALIMANDWKQADAANHCGVTQPRINDLLRERLSRYSPDALVNIAPPLGRRMHVELNAAYPAPTCCFDSACARTPPLMQTARFINE